MTGPEHYQEAERLVNGDDRDIAAAQVHATLALAAAQIDVTGDIDPQWFEVIDR